MIEEHSDAEITQGEMINVLAGFLDLPKARVGGWAIVVALACGAPDCKGLGCEGGGFGYLSAGHVLGADDNEPYLLHLFGSAIDNIATAQRDRS